MMPLMARRTGRMATSQESCNSWREAGPPAESGVTLPAGLDDDRLQVKDHSSYAFDSPRCRPIQRCGVLSWQDNQVEWQEMNDDVSSLARGHGPPTCQLAPQKRRHGP